MAGTRKKRGVLNNFLTLEDALRKCQGKNVAGIVLRIGWGCGRVIGISRKLMVPNFMVGDLG